jgi:hypothetical protein
MGENLFHLFIRYGTNIQDTKRAPKIKQHHESEKKCKSKLHQDSISPSQNGYHQENNNKYWQGCRGNLYTVLVGCKLVQLLWKSVWRFLKKLKIELPCGPTKFLLGIYLKECKSAYNRYTSIS